MRLAPVTARIQALTVNKKKGVVTITGKNRRTGYIYSESELLKQYLTKSMELKRPPSIREINSDPLLPSYWTFLRRIGDKSRICSRLELENIPANIHQQLCRDCSLDLAECQENPFDCSLEAGLYYRSTNSRKLGKTG